MRILAELTLSITPFAQNAIWVELRMSTEPGCYETHRRESGEQEARNPRAGGTEYLSPSMTTSGVSSLFCETLLPARFPMRHFALRETPAARRPTKARVLILRWNLGSTNHLCGDSCTMISQSNSLAAEGGRAPHQHVGDPSHPTGLNRLLDMRTRLADLPCRQSRLPHPPQSHRQLARDRHRCDRAILFHR